MEDWSFVHGKGGKLIRMTHNLNIQIEKQGNTVADATCAIVQELQNLKASKFSIST
jgi:hypothetical protein